MFPCLPQTFAIPLPRIPSLLPFNLLCFPNQSPVTSSKKPLGTIPDQSIVSPCKGLETHCQTCKAVSHPAYTSWLLLHPGFLGLVNPLNLSEPQVVHLWSGLNTMAVKLHHYIGIDLYSKLTALLFSCLVSSHPDTFYPLLPEFLLQQDLTVLFLFKNIRRLPLFLCLKHHGKIDVASHSLCRKVICHGSGSYSLKCTLSSIELENRFTE